MEKNMHHWNVIYTRPRQERKVIESLEKLNIDSFSPFTKSLRVWHDRKKVIEQPLFPGYVFAKIINTIDFHKIFTVSGFVKYVKYNSKAAVVDQSIIDNIKALLCADQELEVVAREFKKGEMRAITDGPLRGFFCEIVEYNGKEKALVRLTILNRSLLVDVPAETVSTFVVS